MPLTNAERQARYRAKAAHARHVVERMPVMWDSEADAFREITAADVEHLIQVAGERTELRHQLVGLILAAVKIKPL